MIIQDDRFHLNKISHAVRATQAVLQYGVGAMVDFPDQTLMTAAPEYWDTEITKIYDERLEKLLDVDYFGVPASKDDKNVRNGISYVRFPEWYFCPKCRKFQPLKKWIKEYKENPVNVKKIEDDPYMIKHMNCTICRQELVVARIISVCSHGHINDFPWVEWVHCKNKTPLAVCPNPELRISTSATSSEGLEGIKITCETCKATATLKDAFNKDDFSRIEKKLGSRYSFRCKGKLPWKHVAETCMEYPQVMQRGSSSVYFPVTESSLVIPPYASILEEKIKKSKNYDDYTRAKDAALKSVKTTLQYIPEEHRESAIIGATDTVIKEFANKIAIEISVSNTEVEKYLRRLVLQVQGDSSYTTTSSKYRYEEYEALSGRKQFELNKYRDFKRESTHIEEYGIPFVKNISLINKIREIQVLTGYTRINPSDKTLPINKQPTIVQIKEPETRWYPAFQVYGEGIFIEFDENALMAWEEKFSNVIHSRVRKLNANYRNSYMGKSNTRQITAKFMLLHTLSHMLLKQLSFECGYSIASIKERIYCDRPGDEEKMAGIFIYTASGDSEGTMGGLVRQGRSDLFPRLFKKAVEGASICSNDPVCSISGGQGRDSLNLAACYSCTLLPETSCEEFNILLDRAMIVGTIDNSDFGLYSPFLKDGWKTIVEYRMIKSENESEPESKQKLMVIHQDTGINFSEMSYKEIFEELSKYTKDDSVKTILHRLSNNSENLDLKEKPLASCDFSFLDETDTYTADLVWMKSKVAFFLDSYEDCYQAAKDSDWNCIFVKDEKTSIDYLMRVIKGE